MTVFNEHWATEAEESALAERVPRVGYLDIAACPVDFTDIADYLDDSTKPVNVALRSQQARRARSLLGRGLDVKGWSRRRIIPSRDEWTP